MAIQTAANGRLAAPRSLLDRYLREASEAMAEQRTDLGKQIAAARSAKNWKQKELAAAVHVEPVTVSRWERGQHAPDIDMLEMIAQVTGKPLSFFVDKAPVAPDATLARLEANHAETQRRLARMEKMLREALGKREPPEAQASG